MHPDDDAYFLEKRARREKYEHPGDDWKYLSRNALKGQPERLLAGFNIDDIAATIRQSLPVILTSKHRVNCMNQHISG